MKQITTPLSSPRFSSLLFSLFSVLLISGLADSSSSSDASRSKKSFGSSALLKVVMICLGLLAIGAFCVFLYKLWQRKKREDQHARLLKLFEQDDELEVELGIRD